MQALKKNFITVTMRRKCFFYLASSNETCQPRAPRALVRSDGTVSDHRDRRTVGMVSAHPVCEVMRHQMCIEVMLDLDITARKNHEGWALMPNKASCMGHVQVYGSEDGRHVQGDVGRSCQLHSRFSLYSSSTGICSVAKRFIIVSLDFQMYILVRFFLQVKKPCDVPLWSRTGTVVYH